MAESPIGRVSRISGSDELGADMFNVSPLSQRNVVNDNPFETVFARAVDALDGVSQTEFKANDLIAKYIEGKVDLPDVLIATSKMSIAVQLAVTTITTAVSTFKEITQMQM